VKYVQIGQIYVSSYAIPTDVRVKRLATTPWQLVLCPYQPCKRRLSAKNVLRLLSESSSFDCWRLWCCHIFMSMGQRALDDTTARAALILWASFAADILLLCDVQA